MSTPKAIPRRQTVDGAAPKVPLVKFKQRGLLALPTKSVRRGRGTMGDHGDTRPADAVAKYIQGSVGLILATSNVATKVLWGRDSGVVVIRLDDGGSLSFYKEVKKFVLRSNDRSNHSSSDHQIKKIDSDQSIFTRDILNKSMRDSFRNLNLDDQMKAKIGKIRVCASTQDFVPPIEMPYVHIPASVPWRFKSAGSKTFQIVVPPTAEGGLDGRVKVMSSKAKDENTRLVSTRVLGKEIQFESVINLFEDNDDDDDGHGSVAKKHARRFAFRCENARELALYAEAAQTLGRITARRRSRLSLGSLAPEKLVRIRDAEGMEVAAQTALINRSSRLKRRVSTIGMQEFRVTPFHAYPNTWMTRKELAVELVRPSSHYHDLRTSCPEEIGSVQIELLQCMGLNNMDRYSLSDAYAYIVCGSSAFTTDVIPDNLNPGWLPKTRRACILPLRNAYSQVFVGTFDYDGEKSGDDFLGRVVVDIPQLRPGLVYDVTLPLRQTSRVYNREKLGCIRLRIQLSWKNGDRSAMLSYLPKSHADITKRLKKNPPEPKTLVWCPDEKSFLNVCKTLYGEDIPGKFHGNVAKAVSREVTMIKRIVNYYAEKTIRDIIRWNNPLLSGYIFTAWMYFVSESSIRTLPSFIISLVVIFMIRNHIKYHVKYNSHSDVGSFYRHRSIRAMCRTLLFNQSDSDAHASQVHRPLLGQAQVDWLLSKVFGISTTSLTSNSWKEEDNSEYPFSSGLHHPKLTSTEAAATHVWEAAQDSSAAAADDMLFLDDDDDEDDGDEWDCDKGLLQNYNKRARKGISSTMHAIKAGLHHEQTGPSATTDRKNAAQLPRETLPEERADSSKTLTGSTYQMPTDSGTTIVIPDQNVNTKSAKKDKSMLDDVEKLHAKVSRANLHLFDNRVFLAEDQEEAQKSLSINESINPIKRMMNPVLGGGMKILDIQVSFFRAAFNLCMWKDPMLSFWFLLCASCLMIILFVFPWRLFFFVTGLLGLGPQNYFVANLYYAKRAVQSRKKTTPSEEEPDPARQPSMAIGDLSDSPLLLRDNVRVKPDGKRRAIIVPGGDCVFRYNRFYDWLPDPASATIEQVTVACKEGI